MIPAAYGFVMSDGSIGSGTANMSSVWNAAQSWYEISLSDQTIGFTHTTIVTVVDSSGPHLATTNVIGGNIVIKIWDITNGNAAITDNFQIVIFNANPDAPITRSPVPTGMDPEYYYEQTGTNPPTIHHAAPIEIPKPASVIRD